MDPKVTIEEKYLIVDGIRTHLRMGGAGYPLVLVHGLGGPSMWQRVIEPLSKQFHAIVIDLPGFGESDCAPKEFSTDEYADFLYHTIEALGIEKAAIAGISYGGQIAATFAARYADRLEKLILIASTGFVKLRFLFRSRRLWDMFSTVVKHTILHSQLLICLFGRFSFYNVGSRPSDLCEEFYRQLSQDGKREAWLNAIKSIYAGQKHFSSTLTSLRCSTLIIWGEDDKTVPAKFASEFQQRIPHSRLRTFAACAHSVPLEKPTELCEALFSFIASS